MILEQLATTTPSVSHAKELYGLATIFLTQLGLAYASHRKGAQRPAEQSKQLDRALANALTPVGIKLDSLASDMQDMKAHLVTVDSLVRGPDGQNGLRGDLRAAEQRIGELERDRLHGAYDRRTD